MASNSTDFTDRSNYLVAFLAVIVGMATFRDKLSATQIEIFGHSTTWLLLAAIMVIPILAAVYIGALAHFSGYVTITKIPLSKYLTNLSIFIALLGLAYPILLGLVLFISWLLVYIKPDPDTLKVLLAPSSFVASILGAVVSFLGTRSFSGASTNKQQGELLALISKELEKSASKPQISEYKFLQEYEELLNFSIRYLKLRGFGIGTHSNLSQLAHILQSKGVFDSTDVNSAVALNKTRNLFAHARRDLSRSEIEEALNGIETLKSKLEKAIVDWD